MKGGYGNEGYAIVELEDSILTFGGYWKNGTCSEYVFQFKVKVALIKISLYEPLTNLVIDYES